MFLYLLKRDHRKDELSDIQKLDCYSKKNQKSEQSHWKGMQEEQQALVELIKIFKSQNKVTQTELTHLQDLKKRIENPIFKIYVNLVMAYKRKNYAWLHFQIRDYVQAGVHYSWFVRSHLNQKMIGLYNELVKELVDKITDLNQLDQNVRDIFKAFIELSYLTRTYGDEEELSYEFSINELREMAKNPRLLQEFFSFIFVQLKSRVSRREELELIKRSLSNYSFDTLNEKQWWALKGFFPKDKELREKVLNGYRRLWKSSDHFSRSIVVEAIDNVVLKNALSKIDPLFKKASFQIRRTFYRDLYDRGIAYEWSAYNLILLGDYPRSFISK